MNTVVVRNAFVWLSVTIAGATYGRYVPADMWSPMAAGAICTAAIIYFWCVYASR